MSPFGNMSSIPLLKIVYNKRIDFELMLKQSLVQRMEMDNLHLCRLFKLHTHFQRLIMYKILMLRDIVFFSMNPLTKDVLFAKKCLEIVEDFQTRPYTLFSSRLRKRQREIGSKGIIPRILDRMAPINCQKIDGTVSTLKWQTVILKQIAIGRSLYSLDTTCKYASIRFNFAQIFPPFSLVNKSVGTDSV